MSAQQLNIYQGNDDNWNIEVLHDSGLSQLIPIGKLTKEQAIQETARRYPGIKGRIFDKEVLAAIREGRVVGIKAP